MLEFVFCIVESLIQLNLVHFKAFFGNSRKNEFTVVDRILSSLYGNNKVHHSRSYSKEQ